MFDAHEPFARQHMFDADFVDAMIQHLAAGRVVQVCGDASVHRQSDVDDDAANTWWKQYTDVIIVVLKDFAVEHATKSQGADQHLESTGFLAQRIGGLYATASLSPDPNHTTGQNRKITAVIDRGSCAERLHLHSHFF